MMKALIRTYASVIAVKDSYAWGGIIQQFTRLCRHIDQTDRGGDGRVFDQFIISEVIGGTMTR